MLSSHILRARGLGVMTPRLQRGDRRFESARAHTTLHLLTSEIMFHFMKLSLKEIEGSLSQTYISRPFFVAGCLLRHVISFYLISARHTCFGVLRDIMTYIRS